MRDGARGCVHKAHKEASGEMKMVIVLAVTTVYRNVPVKTHQMVHVTR